MEIFGSRYSFVKWMLMDGWGRFNEGLELKLQSEGGMMMILVVKVSC